MAGTSNETQARLAAAAKLAGLATAGGEPAASLGYEARCAKGGL
jgi:hypothetical protein